MAIVCCQSDHIDNHKHVFRPFSRGYEHKRAWLNQSCESSLKLRITQSPIYPSVHTDRRSINAKSRACIIVLSDLYTRARYNLFIDEMTVNTSSTHAVCLFIGKQTEIASDNPRSSSLGYWALLQPFHDTCMYHSTLCLCQTILRPSNEEAGFDNRNFSETYLRTSDMYLEINSTYLSGSSGS